MTTMPMREVVACKSTQQPSTLRAILAELDIEPFTPESVTEYKREKLDEITRELRPAHGAAFLHLRTVGGEPPGKRG